MRVRVYRNLHKRCYSILHKVPRVGWRLRGHVDMIFLEDVEFIVSEAGRKRVLVTKRKNVHAFIEGEEIDFIRNPLKIKNLADDKLSQKLVKYNPYAGESFMLLTPNDRLPIFRAKYAILAGPWVKVIV